MWLVRARNSHIPVEPQESCLHLSAEYTCDGWGWPEGHFKPTMQICFRPGLEICREAGPKESHAVSFKKQYRWKLLDAESIYRALTGHRQNCGGDKVGGSLPTENPLDQYWCPIRSVHSLQLRPPYSLHFSEPQFPRLAPRDLSSLVHHLSFTPCTSGSLSFFPHLEYVLTPTDFKAWWVHAVPSAATSWSLPFPAFPIMSSSHPSDNALLAFVLGFVRTLMLFPQDQPVTSKHLQPIWERKGVSGDFSHAPVESLPYLNNRPSSICFC